MEKKTKKASLFFATINRSSLAINKAAAGAGVAGLLGFGALFIVAILFFVTENFFIGMLLLSFALLVYVTGAELAKLFLSSITIFFSSRHLLADAAYLQETLVPLQKFLKLRRDPSGDIKVGPVHPGATIEFPDNPLTRDIKSILDGGQGFDYLEYTAHTYYVECHELYDYSAGHFEFVARSMPLFGLMGTIVGLIGMFDSLSSDVNVGALTPQLALALKCTLYGAVFAGLYTLMGARFEQRMKALDYDFEIFARALQVLVENKIKAEVTR